MNAPTLAAAWEAGKAQLSQRQIDALLQGAIVSLGWNAPAPPPRSRRAGAAPIGEQLAAVYDFRLEFHRDGAWWIDGKGPAEKAWVKLEGPLWAPSPAEQAMDKLGFLLLAVCQPEGSA